jgi:hypothetical protein
MSRRMVVRWIMGTTLVLALAASQDAYGQGRFGGRGARGSRMAAPRFVSTVYTVALPGVEKELGLDEAATDKVKGLMGEYRDDYRKAMGESGARSASVHQKLEGEYEPKLNAILDKNQQTRLHEIAVQAAGIYALQDSGVVKDLDLTKDQQTKIADIVQAGAGEARGAEARHALTEKGVAVLTKDQQEKFEKLQGKPFTFTSPRGRRARSSAGE